MELDALTITCKHMHNERDQTITKLRKQKQAAHTKNCRLRAKLRKAELSSRLLMVILLASENQNQVLRNQLTKAIEGELQGAAEL